MDIDLQALQEKLIGGTTPYWKAKMVLQFLGLTLAIVGYSVPYHLIYMHSRGEGGSLTEIDVGLWLYCEAGRFGSCTNANYFFASSINGPARLQASRTLMTFAWLLEVVVIALTAATLHPSLDARLHTLIHPVVACVSALFGLIGVNVFFTVAKGIVVNILHPYDYLYDDVVKMDTQCGWGYHLFQFGQLAYILCGAIHIYEAMKPSPALNFENPVAVDSGKPAAENTDEEINQPRPQSLQQLHIPIEDSGIDLPPSQLSIPTVKYNTQDSVASIEDPVQVEDPEQEEDSEQED